MEKKSFKTNYAVAVNWCRNNFILLNEIQTLDQSIYDNCHFDIYDEENDEYTDIFQWYLTDCSEGDVEFLEAHFGLLFTYSDLLDKYILCVDHFGTSWDYVECDTDLENAQAELGERL